MTERVFNIIMACKGNFNKIKSCDVKADASNLSAYERVIEYLSEECATPKERYTPATMNSLMFDAMCDYLRTCDNAGSFVRSLKDIYAITKITEGERIASAFELVQVKDSRGYINGFEEFFYDDAKMSEEESKRCVAEFVVSTYDILNKIKDYEVWYGRSEKGKMMINHKGTNYLVSVQAIDHNAMEIAIKNNINLFNNNEVSDKCTKK